MISGAKFVTGVLVAAAVAAPVAVAAPASASTVVTTQSDVAAKPSWKLIWGPVSHKPTKYWPTGDFVPGSKTLRAGFRCWNGGDGTLVRADIVRTKDKKVMNKVHNWYECDGTFKSVTIKNAWPSDAYYMRVYLSGKKHTIEAKADAWK